LHFAAKLAKNGYAAAERPGIPLDVRGARFDALEPVPRWAHERFNLI